MKVIAAVGRNRAGKGTLTDYIHRRCSSPVMASGDVARDLAEERDIDRVKIAYDGMEIVLR